MIPSGAIKKLIKALWRSPRANHERRAFIKRATQTGAVITFTNLTNSTSAKAKSHSETLEILHTWIAGYIYYQDQECLANLHINDTLSLIREPSNQYDDMAIEVYWQDKKLGYIPRVNNIALAKLMDDGKTVVANITDIENETYCNPVELVVKLII